MASKVGTQQVLELVHQPVGVGVLVGECLVHQGIRGREDRASHGSRRLDRACDGEQGAHLLDHALLMRPARLLLDKDNFTEVSSSGFLAVDSGNSGHDFGNRVNHDTTRHLGDDIVERLLKPCMVPGHKRRRDGGAIREILVQRANRDPSPLGYARQGQRGDTFALNQLVCSGEGPEDLDT